MPWNGALFLGSPHREHAGALQGVGVRRTLLGRLHAQPRRTMAMLEPGTLVAKYRILRLLGAGAVVEVYEVVTPDGARRALEILTAEASRATKLEDGAVKEAEAVATIEHANVVPLDDAGREGDRLWMLLDLVEGPDVGRRVREGGSARPSSMRACALP
jgi:serine/threonine protein kinase